MGDQFSSGGSDQQVAKDQATFIEVAYVNQNVRGNSNIISGSGNVNATTIINHNYYSTEKVPPLEKDLASTSEHEDLIYLVIRKESHLYFFNKLKVTWQFQGEHDRTVTYDVDEKKIKFYSIKVTEALDDYFKTITSGLCQMTLKYLAQRGYELFNCLIPDDCPVKDDIKKAKNSVRMIIDSHVDIPWNGMYVDSNIDNTESSSFIGNRYKISVRIDGSEEFFCKSSRYAARDHNRLKEIKAIIAKQFDNTVHLIDRKTSGHDYKDSKLEILECKSLKYFCDQIRGYKQQKNCIPPDLLFICFDKYHRASFFNRENVICIGDLKLPISGLKRELSELNDFPPFVIIVGKEANHKAYIELKNLFIHRLQWNGIFIDGNVDLKLAHKYLSDFFIKFADGNNSVPDVLFELRKENPIGLAFTAYCNDKVCFKKYYLNKHD